MFSSVFVPSAFARCRPYPMSFIHERFSKYCFTASSSNSAGSFCWARGGIFQLSCQFTGERQVGCHRGVLGTILARPPGSTAKMRQLLHNGTMRGGRAWEIHVRRGVAYAQSTRAKSRRQPWRNASD